MDQRETDVLIVGAGAAGHAAATTLRREGFTGTVRIVNDEPSAPYNRTLVDKGILPGLLTPEQAALPNLELLDVPVVRGRATGMDRAESVVHLEGGETLRFRTLVVSVGGTPQTTMGDGVGGVFTLHSASDAVRIREHVGTKFAGRSVTVLGAGLVGTEAASFFVSAGADVHLVARAELPLHASLGEPIAAQLRNLHLIHTDFRSGRVVQAIRTSGRGVEVHLDDGSQLDSDLVVTAQGRTPATSWVSSADAGVSVDDHLRAEGFSRVYAAGGAALHFTAEGASYRIDHWEDATAQGAHVARTILHDLDAGEEPGPYRPVAGFSVNMYGSSLTGVGIARPGAVPKTISVADAGLVTKFIASDGTTTGAAGWAAGRHIQTLRQELLTHP